MTAWPGFDPEWEAERLWHAQQAGALERLMANAERAAGLDATDEDVRAALEATGALGQRATDCALLRDLIDRRPDLNACALRPGQAVHVHARERLLADAAPGGPEYFERMEYHHDRDTLIADLAACRTFLERVEADGDDDAVRCRWDDLIMRARALAGWWPK
jgi:hypothetical protein